MTMEELMEIFKQSDIHSDLLTQWDFDGKMTVRGFDMYKMLDLINKTIKEENDTLQNY